MQGDTVHITWLYGGQRFPYRRSVDEGRTFESIREIAPAFGEIFSFLVANGRTLFGMFATADSGGGRGGDSYLLVSSDRGDTWGMPGTRIDSASWVAYAALQDTFAIIESKFQDGWHIRYTTNRGVTWIRRPQDIATTNEPAIALTPGALHKVAGWVFDSAGVWSEFVIQYRKSTDMGLTWSDSVNLSSIGSRAAEPNIAAGWKGDSSSILTGWKDVKYGCLTPLGCSILGRLSHDAGNSFLDEHRFDLRPAGFLVTLAGQESVLVVGWSDDLPDGGVRITVSFDRGKLWCVPLSVDEGEIWGLGITRGAIHVVYDKMVGSHFRVFYRRGVIPSTSAKESSSRPPPFVTLSQNFPNPFNPATRIAYSIGKRGVVSLKVYDVLGREISEHTEGWKEVGEYSIDWKPIGLTSGVYYYKLVLESPTSGVIELVRKMLLVK